MSSAATHPEGTAAPVTSSHRLPMAYAPRQSPRTQRQRPTSTDPTRSMANIQERSTGSATQTETPTAPSSNPLILRLRGAHDAAPQTRTTRRRRIQWAEDVVDNEGLGRKKSKVCCIYHKNREVGESSSEDDSSDSDCCSSSEEDRDGGAKMAGGGRARRKGRARSPNAYEKMPKHGHNYEHKETEKEGT